MLVQTQWVTRGLAGGWLVVVLTTVGAALGADGKDVVVAPEDGGRLCWTVKGTQTCVPVAVLVRTFDGFKDGAFSPLERALVAERQAANDVMVARAARAECEGLLGPLEAQARRSAQAQAVSALRQQYETDHPGFTLDQAGQPVKKTEGKP